MDFDADTPINYRSPVRNILNYLISHSKMKTQKSKVSLTLALNCGNCQG